MQAHSQSYPAATRTQVNDGSHNHWQVTKAHCYLVVYLDRLEKGICRRENQKAIERAAFLQIAPVVHRQARRKKLDCQFRGDSPARHVLCLMRKGAIVWEMIEAPSELYQGTTHGE